LPGPYAVEELSIHVSAFLNNTAPMNIYRGAGRPEAALLMERLMDRAAIVCGLDPVEIRRRNLVPPGAMPHRTATGESLDSGNYPALLAKACGQAGYHELRLRQRRMRKKGRVFGVGVALYIEPCGQGWESASIGLSPEGGIVACTGATAQGQGRETAFAQIVADTLGIHVDDVTVRHGDTDATPPGIGALASRSTAIGGSALLKAAKAFHVEARRAAAQWLGCEIEMTLPVSGGFFGVICGRTVSWKALAASSSISERGLKLTQTVVLHAESEAWSSGCCVASVSIDPDTGRLNIETLTWVDDAGRIINPMLVEGQLLGGLAQGLGEALMEQLVYDENGQLVTGSFMDYAMPRASDIPAVQLGKMETPTKANPLGAKGVGEAGCIGVPACLMNAVLDALSPFGVQEIDMPMTSHKIWQALNKARPHQDGVCKP
jgi:carbon-monoxide dehydrogenase large subunit